MRYLFTYLCSQTVAKSLLRLTIWRSNESFKLILKIHVLFMYFLDWFWSCSAGWKWGGKKWWGLRIGSKRRAEFSSLGVSRRFSEWSVCDLFHGPCVMTAAGRLEAGGSTYSLYLFSLSFSHTHTYAHKYALFLAVVNTGKRTSLAKEHGDDSVMSALAAAAFYLVTIWTQFFLLFHSLILSLLHI